jgi:choline dehydrogenase-like flavoprotein
VLRAAGLEVRIDQPRVGAGMREHRCFPLQVRLRKNEGYNRRLATPLAQVLTGIQYLATRRGPLASPSYDVVGFLKSDPGQDRVDAQVLLCPISIAAREPGANPELEREPGLQAIGYVLRPTSEGMLHVTGADPDAPLRIVPNYLDTLEDRRTGVALFRRMREMFASHVLASRIDHEIDPGASLDSDEEILEYALARGYCGYHAVGTCAMGTSDDHVVDPQLRVRGVRGLRVMDCSVLPTMVSGNLNGPMMAMANVAADLIRETSSA